MELDAASRAVARNVRRVRIKKRMSLADVSMGLIAIEHPMKVNVLSKLETGRRGVKAGDLGALARVLGVAVEELLDTKRCAVCGQDEDMIEDTGAAVTNDDLMRRLRGYLELIVSIGETSVILDYSEAATRSHLHLMLRGLDSELHDWLDATMPALAPAEGDVDAHRPE